MNPIFGIHFRTKTQQTHFDDDDHVALVLRRPYLLPSHLEALSLRMVGKLNTLVITALSDFYFHV